MMIEKKSIGQLVDELTTSAFRLAWARATGASDEELMARLDALVNAVDQRLGAGVGPLIFDLVVVLKATWDAQEIIMADRSSYKETAVAARQAQRGNAHRSRLIRRIDALLGEDGITVATKTYDASRSPLAHCPKCGWFSLISDGVNLSTAVDKPGDPCKYGCGPVRLATDVEAEWWRDPNKTDTLQERRDASLRARE